ncbi:MAG TPA: Hpt domain-containing protein, partial [Myxococcota bacterium]
MAIDREKYRRLFIEEARESLRTFNNELVALEKLLQSEAGAPPAQTRAVMDAAFRTAHSLKGMGAAMGYTRFADLAHALEDLAEIARGGGAIGSEGFDLLLEGSDRLEEMVERVAGGDEDPDAGDLTGRVHARVVAAKAATAPSPAPAPAPAPAPPTPQPATSTSSARPPLIAKAVGRGVGLRVRIADDASLPQVRAFVVHKALVGLPGYRETEPPAESLRQKELPGRTLIVRFDVDADIDGAERIARQQQGVAEVTREEAVTVDEPVVAEKPQNVEDDRTVRVRTALLDDLLDSVGELLLARSRIRTLAGRMDLPELTDLVDEVERLTRDLHGRVVAARMTPLLFIAERFPRVVRDLARAVKKSVDFSMQGTEIELDRAILDELSAPFLHMLRNSVDHAHEGDDARKAAGKPAAMKLTLRASRERDTVLLELVDDGGGMDPARIRRRAVERGLLTQAAATAQSDEQALELICLPGFSTAEQVSQTSGRGVGMDVVK